ncbi:MAG: DUF3526 domain-containing protein [Acidobacteria bacterium]|nr:DUF3526 domain-containing protein [Acidobacteriota bacterium]
MGPRSESIQRIPGASQEARRIRRGDPDGHAQPVPLKPDGRAASSWPALERFDQQLASQQGLTGRFRYLSLAIAAQPAFNDLAGSSPDRYKHFLRQADGDHQRSASNRPAAWPREWL